MSTKIGSNASALTALRHLETADQALSENIARLSSGNRIQKAGDDPAGLAKSAFLEVNLRDQRQIQRNAEDARSLMQVTENGLNEVNNLLIRMRELSIAAASDIAGPEEREAIQIELTAIKDDIDRIAQSTYYGKHYLLNGSTPDLNFQVGVGQEDFNRITYSGAAIDVQSGSLGVDGVDGSDPDSAFGSLEVIDEAIAKVQGFRAQTGALQSRMNSVISQTQANSVVIASDLSRVKDTDYAKESSEFMSNQIRQHAAVMVLSQANLMPEQVLRLLTPGRV